MGNAETIKEDTSILAKLVLQKISKIKTCHDERDNARGIRDEYLENEP